MHIREIMSAPALTCRATDRLDVAAHQMWDHDCGAVLVVGDDGRLVGVVTDRDICMAAFTNGSPLHTIAVSVAMSRRVFACRADDSIEAAERLMRDKQIRRVPVIDADNRPVGIVSLNDLARHAVSGPKKNGSARQVVETLAEIGRPRKGAIQVSRAGQIVKQASKPH